MAYTVDSAFDAFYQAINLTGNHRETANSRKERIVELLKNDFQILDAFSTGSIPKYTALKGRADLDVIVVLHYGKHIEGKSPAQLLASVRTALSGYTTSVRRNGQAVTLTFKTWPNVDIVPVSRTTNNNGSVSHYNVPDATRDTWIKSRPRKLAQDIENKSSECGENFRRIIKMIKHWNSQHSSYLSSYHIEVLALNIFSGDLADTSWNVFQFFQSAYTLVTNSLWYELGFADDYLDLNARAEALRRLETATSKARDAWYCTCGGRADHKGAIEIWRQIFGGSFPSYG